MKLNRSSLNRSLLGVIVLSVVSVASPMARAQDDPPSPIEVQLRREIATLRDRLAAAEERIRRLEGERDTLLEQLAAARSSASESKTGTSQSVDAGPQELRAPVPADPFASPASMLNEVRDRYESEFEGLPHDTDPAIVDYKKDVESWCKAGLRDLRDRRQWLISVGDLEPRPNDRRQFDATIRVIDELTGLPIGDPLKTTIDATSARKIEAGKDRYGYWRVTVAVSALLEYNESLADEGVFENPAFVGRYCEFDVEVNWRLFQGVRTEEVEKNLKPAPPALPSGR